MGNPSRTYATAYQAYLRTGNLAQAAREGGVNESSLREYARNHDWKGDRAKELQAAQDLQAQVLAGADKLVADFYKKPTSNRAKAAREGMDLASMLGGRRTPGEEALHTYDGSREAYRELLMANLLVAMRTGKTNTVQRFLQMLAQVDGHRPNTGPGETEPDFAAMGSLLNPSGPVFEGPEGKQP